MSNLVPNLDSMNEKRKYMNAKYSFVSTSPLQDYLSKRKCNFSVIFTLAQILTCLKKIILKEKLYDENNLLMIICDADLEKALKIKACRVADIPWLVKKHLILKDGCARTVMLQNTVLRNQLGNEDLHSGNWIISRGLRAVFNTLPHFPKRKKLFTLANLIQYLSQYIIRNKERLIDPRNVTIAVVEKDILGYAFGVKAFHVSQAKILLRREIARLSNLDPVSETETG
jgi:hypothetical protein